jgi:hypothetical protein
MTLHNVPRDERLHHIYSDALAWAMRRGLPVTDENVQPIYESFLERYREADGSINPDKQAFATPAELPYAFPDVPGLIVRLATLDDVPLVVGTLVRRGNYSVERGQVLIEDAIKHRLCWAFLWEWNGKPLQFEALFLGTQGDVYLGYTVHLTRERPHWFWRELERPLWRWVREAGFTYVGSLLRADRSFWLPVLKENYKAEVVEDKVNEQFIPLRLPARDDVFQGWPARRTAGPDWSLTFGNITFREATEADFPAIADSIATNFKRLSRRDIVEEILDAWWHLDRAAILLGYENGALKYARAVRTRRGNDANISMLNPISRSVGNLTATYAFGQWLKALGYETVTSFIPEEQHITPSTQAFLAAGHMKLQRVLQFNQPFYEYQADVTEFAAQTLDEWLAKPRPREATNEQA